MRFDTLAAMDFETNARRACVLITNMDDGAQRLYLATREPADPVEAAAREALHDGQSKLHSYGAGRYFFTVALPSPRLVIVGASHVAQALAPMSIMAGFDVAIIDPRAAFASPERFPQIRLIAQWPQDAFAAAPLDAFCAVALLSHTPDIDDPAQSAALDAECFYIGALGSRKTQAARFERLAAAGRAHQADRIRAPIGLDIGAKTPAEIAVATLAEVVATLRGRGASSR
jgi:xanthine dehydrogenase accessory factor